MIPFDFFLRYPGMVKDILLFFKYNYGDRTVQDFFTAIRATGEKGEIPIACVTGICEALCAARYLISWHRDSGIGMNDAYLFAPEPESWESEQENYFSICNSIAYGPEYIYHVYRKLVLPVITEKNGTPGIGTCFLTCNGIATAKHCLKDVDVVAIPGFSANVLSRSAIYVSEDDGVDIAFINGPFENKGAQISVDSSITEDVLTLGYPNIPGFETFLTAEKAAISSMPIPTVGSIAAQERHYLTRTDMMLITAKIKGGNSGGPVVNKKGCVVGIACQAPDFEDNKNIYDDLGYGAALPSKYLLDIINEKRHTLAMSQVSFKDYA